MPRHPPGCTPGRDDYAIFADLAEDRRARAQRTQRPPVVEYLYEPTRAGLEAGLPAPVSRNSGQAMVWVPQAPDGGYLRVQEGPMAPLKTRRGRIEVFSGDRRQPGSPMPGHPAARPDDVPSVNAAHSSPISEPAYSQLILAPARSHISRGRAHPEDAATAASPTVTSSDYLLRACLATLRHGRHPPRASFSFPRGILRGDAPGRARQSASSPAMRELLRSAGLPASSQLSGQRFTATFRDPSLDGPQRAPKGPSAPGSAGSPCLFI
jgi:hypothetical protein